MFFGYFDPQIFLKKMTIDNDQGDLSDTSAENVPLVGSEAFLAEMPHRSHQKLNDFIIYKIELGIKVFNKDF